MEFYDNKALVVQIVIICKDKRSYSQRDVFERIEGGYAIIFQGFIRRIMTFRQEVTRMSCDDGHRSGKQGVDSENGCQTFCRRNSLSRLTIFIGTVTVSAAEDLQASGERQQLSLKRRLSKQSIARCTGYHAAKPT